jgi:hypothetical protein
MLQGVCGLGAIFRRFRTSRRTASRKHAQPTVCLLLSDAQLDFNNNIFSSKNYCSVTNKELTLWIHNYVMSFRFQTLAKLLPVVESSKESFQKNFSLQVSLFSLKKQLFLWQMLSRNNLFYFLKNLVTCSVQTQLLYSIQLRFGRTFTVRTKELNSS